MLNVSSPCVRTWLSSLVVKNTRNSGYPRVLFSTGTRNDNQQLPLHKILKEKVLDGILVADPQQERAAKLLSKVQKALDNYDNKHVINQILQQEQKRQEDELGIAKMRMWCLDIKAILAYFNNTESAKTRKSLEKSNDDEKAKPTDKNKNNNSSHEMVKVKIPRGIYLYGEVGTGKSMLMDMFFNSVSSQKKQRVHFHSFLQSVHQRIHRLKQQDLKNHGRNFHVDVRLKNNPIVRVGKQLAEEVSLLCFDEFQVTDVADALILSQLFQTLFENGTVVVATSNRPPSDLYEGGINRSYFLPFVDLLQHYCVPHNINATVDYRQLSVGEGKVSYFISSPTSFDNIFHQKFLCEESDLTPLKLSVPFHNRDVLVQHQYQKKVAKFHFDELCRRELGSADYRILAETFPHIAIHDIPYLSTREHDSARRFITLIDELYEANCSLLLGTSNKVQIHNLHDLFQSDTDQRDSSSNITLDDPNDVQLRERLGIDVAQPNGSTVGELAIAKELRFAFRRAASRITEMCSNSWWEQNRHQKQFITEK